MTDVFISYAREDESFVRDLYEELKKLDRDAWIDWEGIPPTAEWLNEIYAAIEAADTVLCIMSPDSVASDICCQEIQHAAEQNKRLVPIIRRAVEPEAIPEALARLQWIFFREEDDFETAFQLLTDTIDTDLDQVREHTRLLVRAKEWDGKEQDNSFVLRGRDLKEAEHWLEQSADREPKPTSLQTRYVIASRKFATKRQWLTLGAVSLGFIIAVVLAAVAVIQRQAAVRSEQSAVVARDQAIGQLNSLQLTRVVEVSKRDPGRGLELLYDKTRCPLHLRDFTWHLYSRLCTRYRFALGGMRNPTAVIAFSPNSKLLATASAHEINTRFPSTPRVAEVYIWDVATGIRLATFQVGYTGIGPGSSSSIHATAMAFSPDNLSLATATADGVITLWDLTTHAERVISNGSEGEILALAFAPNQLKGHPNNPDGQTLAALTLWGDLLVWTLAKGQDQPKMYQAYRGKTLTFTRGGRELVVGGLDEIKRWDIVTGQELAPVILSKNSKSTKGAALSPDGLNIAMGFLDGQVDIWDAATGERLRTLTGGHASEVKHVAFSPDGQTLASAGKDHTVRLWDVAAGEILLTLRGAKGPVSRVVFSPDGKTLAAEAADSTLFLWELEPKTEQPAFKLDGIDKTAKSMIFAPDGRSVAVVRGNNSVELWDTEIQQVRSILTKQVKETRQRSPSEHSFGRFSPDGQMLATVDTDNNVVLWDVVTGHERTTFLQHSKNITTIQFTPDNQVLATVGRGETVQLWNVETGQLIESPSGSLSFPISIPEDTVRATCSNTKIQAVGNSRGELSFRDGDADSEHEIKQAHSSRREVSEFGPGVLISDKATYVGPGVTALACSPEGRTLVSGGGVYGTGGHYGQGELNLWDPTQGELLTTLPAPSGIVSSLAFTADGKKLAVITDSRDTGTDLGTAVAGALWNAAFGPERATLFESTGAVLSLTFSHDGRWLTTGSRAGTLRVWDVTTNREVAVMQAHKGHQSIAFSPDNKTLVSASENESIQFWQVKTGTEQGTFPVMARSAFAYAPDGQTIAVGSTHGSVDIWDLTTKEERLDISRDMYMRDYVASLVFSRDGKTLVAGSHDQTVKIWDTATGRALHTLEGHEQNIQAVAISPDGKTVASVASYDQINTPAELKLWDAETGKKLVDTEEASNVVTSIAFAPDGKTLVTAGRIGNLYGQPGFVNLWDATTLRQLATLTGHRDMVHAVAFSPDGRTLASAGEDGVVRLWDMARVRGK